MKATEPQTTFDKVKAAYINRQHDWMNCHTRFVGNDLARMAAVLTSLNRFLLPAYDVLFVETEMGTGWVTAISEEGIRVEYFEGRDKGNSEWIHADDHVGNANATRRTFVEQAVRNAIPRAASS